MPSRACGRPPGLQDHLTPHAREHRPAVNHPPPARGAVRQRACPHPVNAAAREPGPVRLQSGRAVRTSLVGGRSSQDTGLGAGAPACPKTAGFPARTQPFHGEHAAHGQSRRAQRGEHGAGRGLTGTSRHTGPRSGGTKRPAVNAVSETGDPGLTIDEAADQPGVPAGREERVMAEAAGPGASLLTAEPHTRPHALLSSPGTLRAGQGRPARGAASQEPSPR